MIAKQSCNTSDVLIGQPPFREIRGQEAAPCREGQPSTVTGNAERYFFPIDRIAQHLTKGNKKPPPVVMTLGAAYEGRSLGRRSALS